jgi:hypothetical protein
VTFTKPAAERIARVVREIEGGDRDGLPIAYGMRGAADSRKVFRVCTFTGSWAIGATKTVTFREATATPNTVAAMNLFCGLNPTGSCDVSIAKDGTAWYLVQPNVTQLPGYSASGTQVMVIVSGNLRFIGTTAC